MRVQPSQLIPGCIVLKDVMEKTNSLLLCKKHDTE